MRFARLLFLCAASLMTGAAVMAQEAPITIDPLGVKLSPSARSGAIAVKNRSTTKRSFIVYAHSWQQGENGADDYGDADDLVYFPRRLDLAPGAEAVIRLGVRVPARGKEASYRLFIEEDPEAERPEQPAPVEGGAIIRFRMRFALPVFVAPQVPRDSLKVSAAQAKAGKLEVTVENGGNRHEDITIAFAKSDGSALDVPVAKPKPGYLLAGTSIRYVADLDAAACKSVRQLTVLVQGKATRGSAAFPVDPAMCD